MVGAALAAAVHWWQLGESLAWLLLGLFVVKDLVLFPFVRRAYEPSSGGGARALVGRIAVASDPLAPAGYVRLGGELWRAELRSGDPAAAGARLRVVDVRGLTLMVERFEEERSP